MPKKGNEIQSIGVFTSGGDAPGMNAAIRAVVRTATYHNLHIYGIHRGYEGMIKGGKEYIERMDPRQVGQILQMGGTRLKTARSDEFRSKAGRKLAYENLNAYRIDACVAIGGDGTFTGAKKFTEEYDIPFIGIPGTIDNDLYGTDFTVGFDTAVNTAVEAVDKIRDTADSHNRLFFVEVMGRHAGFIALHTGIATGSSRVLVPEADTPLENIVDKLKRDAKRDKLFSVVVVAEGNKWGGAETVAKMVSEQFDHYETKVTVIGHMQRGGSPTAADRVLASRLGFHAVEGLRKGHHNVMVGVVNNLITYTPFKDAISKNKPLNNDLVKMANILSI